MNEYEEKLLKNIEEHGCQVTHVFDNETDTQFSYSIGIFECTGEPELLITGLKKELAHWIINEYNRRITEGEHFDIDTLYSGFLDGFEVMFKDLDPECYSDYLGSCMWLYEGKEFDAYQLIWPSTKGTWPWDKKASEEYLDAMLKLYID